MQRGEAVAEDLAQLATFDKEAAWQKQAACFAQPAEPKAGRWKLWLSAAAALLLIAGTTSLFWTDQAAQPANQFASIAPGGDHAIITLEDGSTIVLEDGQAGVVIDSTLNYESGKAVNENARLANAFKSFTLATPRGGQYRMTMPDGSKVWLNSATKLHYSENADMRTVTLSGEAYFEVASCTYIDGTGCVKAKPFRVLADEQEIRVVGTHFNIKAYADEPAVETTLVSGIVDVSQAGQSLRLAPHEQTFLLNGNLAKRMVEVEQIVGWKNGYFVFVNEDLGEIIKQLSRWYDVDFKLDDPSLKNQKFEAMLPRFTEIQELFDLLERTGTVKFVRNGEEIIVKNNK